MQHCLKTLAAILLVPVWHGSATYGAPPRVLFSDDFEQQAPGGQLSEAKPAVGAGYADTGKTTIVATGTLPASPAKSDAGKNCARCSANAARLRLRDSDVAAARGQTVRFRFDLYLAPNGNGGPDIRMLSGDRAEASRAFNLLIDRDGAVQCAQHRVSGKMPVGSWVPIEILADYARHVFRARVGNVTFVGRFDRDIDTLSEVYFGRFGSTTYYYDNVLVELVPDLAEELAGAVATFVSTEADLLRSLETRVSPFDVGTAAQLFVDRILVRDCERVWFTQHPGRKHPNNPVLKPDQPWEGWRAEIFGNVLFDEEEKLFKMWYLPEPAGAGGYFDDPNVTCYAISRDGVAWEKPLVGTLKAKNGKPHNAVAHIHQASVLKDLREPDPAKRYKCIGWSSQPLGYNTFISPDGLNWTRSCSQPIAPGGDVMTGFWDAERALYVAFPKINSVSRGHQRRLFATIISKDFAHWTEPMPSFGVDLRDDAGSLARIEQVRPILDRPDDPRFVRSEYYGIGAYPAESCTLAFPWILTVNNNARWGNHEGPEEIQLAVSRDLIHWDRPFRTPIIGIGEIGRWDASYHTTAATALRVKDEIWLYYSGANYTHGSPPVYRTNFEDGRSTGRKTHFSAAIGLVTWPLDRFVSADAGSDGGVLTTIPLRHGGDRLEINAAVKPGGEIVVELLDAAGRPLEGFPPSEQFRGDDLRHAVRFGGQTDVSASRGKPVVLRFGMKKAELYSFAFRSDNRACGGPQNVRGPQGGEARHHRRHARRRGRRSSARRAARAGLALRPGAGTKGRLSRPPLTEHTGSEGNRSMKMKRIAAACSLGLAALVGACSCSAWGSPADTTATRPGCYISTGDNDWLWDSPPTQSPADIEALFNVLQKVFDCDRIYWRGLQSELIVDHFQVRPENFIGHGFWEWQRHLVHRVRTSAAAVATAHKLGLEIWGFTGLFEHGAGPDSDAAKGFGPSPIEDRLRIAHPEWIPLDRCGLRRQSGPIELAYPEARRELVRRYGEAVSRGGYDGLMFYTYVEHFAITFPDEFGYNDPIVAEFKRRHGRDIRAETFDRNAWNRLRGEYVTQFLRELKGEFARRGKKLGVALDPQDTHLPAPWLCDRGVHPAGRMHLDWERWVRDKLVDEIMVYCNGDQEEAINDVLAVTEETGCRVSAIHGVPFRPEWRHFDRRGVKQVMVGSDRRIETGYAQFQPPEALQQSDARARLRVLQQVVESKTSIAIQALIDSARDPDVLVRRKAVAALAAQSPPAVEAIEDKLNDPEHSVRCAAAEALGRGPGGQSVAKLFAAVKTHGNFQFEMAVASALSRMKAEQTDPILRGLDDADPRVRRVASVALRSGLMRPEARPSLTLALSDGDAVVRFNAVAALARFGGRPEIVETLRGALDDANPTVRSRAAVALGSLLGSKSRWLGPDQWAVYQRLCDLFGRSRSSGGGADASWDYRPIGNALLAMGPRGKESLESFQSGAQESRLPDCAWQVLHVPQNGFRYCTLSESEAARNYRKHPRFFKPAAPRPIVEPTRMVYLSQSFDREKPTAEGLLGDPLNDCGLWRVLGQVHPAPVLQDKVRHGDCGSAVRLRRCAPGEPHALFALRNDYRLRNEKTRVEFWVYRDSPTVSLAVLWKSTAANDAHVGVHVKPDGKLAVMTEGRKWAETATTVPASSWQRLALEIDPGSLTYRVRAGEDLRSVVREGIAIPPGLEWNSLMVAPQPPEGETFYLDNVLVTVPNPASGLRSARSCTHVESSQ